MSRATKSISLLLLFFSLVLSVYSQPGKQSRKEYKAALKEAKEHLRYEEFNQAIPAIRDLLKDNPDSPYYNYWMGKCLYITYKKNQALPFFEKVAATNPDVDKEFHYYYGLTLHYNLLFDQAIQAYRKDLTRYEPESQEYVRVANRINQCKYAKKLSKKKDSDQVKIDNMGDRINTPFAEHSPVISANDSVLLFTARRPSSLGADEESYFFDEDIYISERKNGQWTEAKNIDRPVNSKGHDATISLSADGKKLYLYRHKKAGGLYFTDFDTLGQKWKEPVAVQKPLNSKYYEASICQSADSSMLFFTSDRPGGEGGRDIYMVRRKGKKDWTEPVNLGPTINTKFDEDAPYLHPDGKTLYYSSDGPNSMGGFDIFVTEIDSSQESGWLPPLNMGTPVNTADDDIYFVLSADGKNGYYASGKEGGYGEKDIYHIEFPYYPYPRRYFIVELAGMVQDVQTLDTLTGIVTLVDNTTNRVLDSIYTGNDSASFYFILEPQRSYSLVANVPGYESNTAQLNTPTLDDADIFLRKNIFLDKPEIVKTPPPVFPEIQHIYYDFDQDDLRDGSPQELDIVAAYLDRNPDVSLRILSHTDFYGTYDYNVDLSRRRAQSAYDYLSDEYKIPDSRITMDNFSENKPMMTNENDEGRQFNRRTEFQFVRDDKVIFASVRLRTGVETIVVDHTTPKGQPGYDNPSGGLIADGDGGVPGSREEEDNLGQDGIAVYEEEGNDGADETAADPRELKVSNTEIEEALVRENLMEANTAKLVKENVFRHIYFDFDKYNLRSRSVEELEKIQRILASDPALELEIYGHTDSYGSTAYNQRLSENRAESALGWLDDNGIQQGRLVDTGFSELDPLDTNANAKGRQNNRRVEFRIVKNGKVVAQSIP